jgi:hypothetical protein
MRANGFLLTLPFSAARFSFLMRVMTILTLRSYVACSPQRFGARQNRAHVGQLLHETHLDDTMKLVGVWPAWEGGQRGRAR